MFKKATIISMASIATTSLATPFIISCSNHQSNNESNIDPSVSEQLKKEKERIDNLNLSWKSEPILLNDFIKIQTIPANDFLSKYINNWTSSNDFKYELEFTKGIDKNQFKIKISLGSNPSYLYSNLVSLPKSIQIQELTDQIALLNKDNTNIFAKKEFSSLEIDLIQKDNNKLLSYLNITKNENFEYTISNLSIAGNEFKFLINIDVVKKLNELEFATSQATNEISFSYTIVESINSEKLTKEKERINSLSLTWKDSVISLDDFNKMGTITANDFLSKYINNWTPNNDFKYELEIVKTDNKNQFKIKISLDSNSLYSYSNPIDLPKSIQIKEIIDEVNKLNGSTNIVKKVDFNLAEINAIEKDNQKLLDYLDLEKNDQFNYLIVNFTNDNSQFNFKIKLMPKDQNAFELNSEQETKEFQHSYSLEKYRKMEGYLHGVEGWFEENFSNDVKTKYKLSSHHASLIPGKPLCSSAFFVEFFDSPQQIIVFRFNGIEKGWEIIREDKTFFTKGEEVLKMLNYATLDNKDIFSPMVFFKEDLI